MVTFIHYKKEKEKSNFKWRAILNSRWNLCTTNRANFTLIDAVFTTYLSKTTTHIYKYNIIKTKCERTYLFRLILICSVWIIYYKRLHNNSFQKNKYPILFIPLGIYILILFSSVCLFDDARHFQQYFSYIVAVSFIGGGKQSTRRKQMTRRKSLIMLFTSLSQRRKKNL